MSEQQMVCKALAAMIRKHGEPTEEEVKFIGTAAFDLALSPEENEDVRKVLEEGGDYQALIEAVTSKPMRAYLFRRVVAAALLDDKIENHELEVIDRTARTFGFPQDAVTDYIAWMKEGIEWEQRGAELMARLQPPAAEPETPSPPPYEG
jgi:hypothetical protein